MKSHSLLQRIIWLLKIINVAVVLFISIPVLAQDIIYVSPYGDDSNTGLELAPVKSINKAIVMAKSSGSNVKLLPGIYIINDKLYFSPDQSGSKNNPLIISGTNAKEVIVSGGKQITGWKKLKDGKWYVNIPEVKNGNWWFNQLFVNGKQQTRARIPNTGFKIVKGFPEGTSKTVHYHTDCQSFEYADGDIDPKWKNLDDVEVIVYHFWTDSHLPIQSIDDEKNIVTFKHKAGKVFTDDFTENGARYIIEHVYEGLDQPGEWYLDRKKGRLYIVPESGVNLNNVEVIAPVIPQLIDFEGNALERNWVKNIVFENISFRHTNWQLPAGNSNDKQGSSSVPAAISLKGAQNIVFQNCEFSNLGTFAFEIGEGCSNNSFVHNKIENIAGGAFRINGGEEYSHPLLQTSNNIVSDNIITNYGTVYPSAVGILLMHTYGNQITHNEISYGYYTGISNGWEWGYQRSINRDNLIAYNHIHHIGQGLLSDMGAIYTLGISPGTVIKNNLIHDVDANHYGGWGIYNDEGSSHILIENNIVYNTKFAGYNIHFAKEITVRNNIFALGRLQQLSRSRMEPHTSVFFENNIIYWTEGELLDNNWKDKPYTFYFHPKNQSGTREITNTFDMDYNVYYNPTLPLDSVKFNGNTWKEWHQKGKDRNSLYEDPLFVDPHNYDFSLKENSPAFKLGFKNIDIEKVGPRNVHEYKL